MPLLVRFGLDNYAHAQTVDTRPFFLGRVGPGRAWERGYPLVNSLKQCQPALAEKRALNSGNGGPTR